MTSPDMPAAIPAIREQRGYRLDGLTDRDVLVFKSMVRLLGHRTQHEWVYSPLSTELSVVADGLPAAQVASVMAQQILTLGVHNVHRHSYLRLPVHANELEAELNRLGLMIAPAPKAAPALSAEPTETRPMRMLRWPPASQLTTLSRVRLATLMSGKPMTIYELQQRSKENLAVCTAFFKDLKQMDLLVPVVTAQPQAVAYTANTPPRSLPVI